MDEAPIEIASRRFPPPCSIESQQSRRLMDQTDGFAFPPINTVWVSINRGCLTVVPNRCLPRQEDAVRLAKHTSAVSSLKRRFCDNGTKLCLPLLAAAYSFGNRLTKRSSAS
jgi:hypothetical protein